MRGNDFHAMENFSFREELSIEQDKAGGFMDKTRARTGVVCSFSLPRRRRRQGQFTENIY